MALIRVPLRVLVPTFIVSIMLIIIGWCVLKVFREGDNDPVKRVTISNNYQGEGVRQFEMGHFAEAERLFLLSDLPENRIYKDRPNGTAYFWLYGVYVATARYELAAQSIDEFLKILPGDSQLLEDKKQYQLLAHYRDSGDPKPLIAFIEEFKGKYANDLPPLSYRSVPNISTILHLYNITGHHDEGIRFIDEVLAYFRTGKAGDPAPGRVDAEFLKVREGFERDKVEGFKGCAGVKPGDECVGHAMWALIKSDYFPW